jgi:hypothetical protein
MAAPFPLFSKGLIEIFSPKPRAFRYGSYFIPHLDVMEVRISKKLRSHLGIGSVGKRFFWGKDSVFSYEGLIFRELREGFN